MVTTYITGTLVALSTLTLDIHSNAINLLHSDNVHVAVLVALSTLTIIHSCAIRLQHGDNIHHGYTCSTEYTEYNYTYIYTLIY